MSSAKFHILIHYFKINGVQENCNINAFDAHHTFYASQQMEGCHQASVPIIHWATYCLLLNFMTLLPNLYHHYFADTNLGLHQI